MVAFAVTQFEPTTLVRMATPRDPAVTEYVRWRMREVIASKRFGTQDQVAKRMGVSPAYLSSLWKTGVGGRSIDAFAKILDFKDADTLRFAAYDWYRKQSPRTQSRADEPAVAAAIRTVLGLHPWVTEEQLRTILHRFAHEDFDGRDEAYWTLALGQEIAQDALRAQRLASDRQVRRGEREREKRTVQGAFREASTLKKRKSEAERKSVTAEHESQRSVRRGA